MFKKELIGIGCIILVIVLYIYNSRDAQLTPGSFNYKNCSIVRQVYPLELPMPGMRVFTRCFDDAKVPKSVCIELRTGFELRLPPPGRFLFPHQLYSMKMHYLSRNERNMSFNYSFITTGCTSIPLERVGNTSWFYLSNPDIKEFERYNHEHYMVWDHELYQCFRVKVVLESNLSNQDTVPFPFRSFSEDTYKLCIFDDRWW